MCGSTIVQVTHNGHTTSLPLVVTEGNGPTLLGRNWLEALRLDRTNIFRIGNNLSQQQILTQHADVFKEELSICIDTRKRQSMSPVREVSTSTFRNAGESRERA